MEQQFDGSSVGDTVSGADDECMRRSARAPKSSALERRSRSRRVLGLVLAVAFGAGGMLAAFGGRPVENLVAGVVVSLALCALLEVGVALHEAGHVLAGRLVGFRFVECRVGPAMLKRTRQGMRLMRSGRYYGGHTRSAPMVGDHLRFRWVVFAAGGPLMTVVWIGVLVALAVAIPAVSAVAWLTAISWVLILPLNILPIRLRGQDVDGKLILRALRSDARFERSLALGGIAFAHQQGVRPREWAESLVSRALEPADETKEHLYAMQYTYAWALDSERFELAGHSMDQVMAREGEQALAPIASSIWALECAYFTARHRDNPTASREWLARGEGALFSSFLRPRALAAILLAEGKPEEALTVAEDGLRELGRAGAELERYETEARCEAENLRDMAAWARAALSQLTPTSQQ